MKIVGGFFALHLPDNTQAHNLLSLWKVPGSPHVLFANGRSALHYLLVTRKLKTLWLPAYCCTSLTQAAELTGTRLRFFPQRPGLSPDADYLKHHLEAGDAVLAVDYFGRNPDKEFLALARSLPAITWIEDRAQAMLPSDTAWGDYIIYSPRKLLGVPDGGILLSQKAELPSVHQPWRSDVRFIDAALSRYEDQSEIHNEEWHAHSRHYEGAMEISSSPMSRISQHILAATDPRPLIQARHANYNYLMDALEDIALFPPHDRGFVPFGFPVRVPGRQNILAFLHSKKIFAAHHWPELPSDPAAFASEHRLNEQLITLPVDHRYTIQDMQRIVTHMRDALR